MPLWGCKAQWLGPGPVCRNLQFERGEVAILLEGPGPRREWRDLGHFQRRLGAALRDENATVADIAPLLRQEFAIRGAGADRSVVPERLSGTELKDCGVLVGSSGRVVNVLPYQPAWVRGPVDAIDDVHAAGGPGGSVELQWDRIPSDPVVSEVLGFPHYRGAGQRDAVRAALRAPAGEVLAVVLPTGTGKTLAGLARGLAGTGTTVVIVPTVALALDQERQLRERADVHDLPSDLAYHGGLDKDVQARIRQKIREGTQRLVYCSPEAAVGSLASPLTDLAETGRLETLVVDECHLVNAWGETFRPEFQLLPALRRMLVATAESHRAPAPVTILLTATMTSDTLETLGTLFDLPPDHLIEVQRLRPEPRYLLGQAVNEEARLSQLDEFLRHAPRPAIVYVTRPRDAERLADGLRQAGHTRLRVFHGGTPSADRDSALAAWAGESPTADVMLATSAFGLGVDVADVRTVVHACLPESIDRFYQEVGRGGRDGAPSLSLLIPVLPEPRRDQSSLDAGANEAVGAEEDDILDRAERAPDLDIARSLSRRKAIGDPKGSNRWRTLRAGAALENGLLVTDVRYRPARLADVGQSVVYDSPRNREWNWSTLNLLARAGAVRLRLRRPRPVPEELEGDDRAVQRFFDEQNSSVYLLPGDRPPPLFEGDRQMREAAFGETVSAVRTRMRERADASFQAMLAVARGEACTAQMLSREYARTVHTPQGPAQQAPAGACSGCPSCGHVVVAESPDVTPPQVRLFPTQPGTPLAAQLGEEGRLVLLLPPENHPDRLLIRSLLERLMSVGVRHVVSVGDVGGLTDERLLRLAGATGRSLTVDREFDEGSNPPVPTVVVVGAGGSVPLASLGRLNFPVILLAAADAEDPRDDRGLLLAETHACTYPKEVMF